MSVDKKISQHPGVLYHDDVQSICQPLSDLDITYFAHVRVKQSGELSAITNNPDYQTHYFANQYYNCDIHLADTESGDMIVWDCVHRDGNSEQMARDAKAFGVAHLFTLVKKNSAHADYFHFASANSDETINQRYLSQRGQLDKFTHLYQDKLQADKNLSEALAINFCIDKNEAQFDFGADKSHVMPEAQKHYISFKNRPFVLTNREYYILHWMSLGKIAADIGLILNISPSTVRKHIENIKQKSGCYTAFQLGILYAAVTHQ